MSGTGAAASAVKAGKTSAAVETTPRARPTIGVRRLARICSSSRYPSPLPPPARGGGTRGGSSPSEVVVAERQIAITLLGDLEDGVGNAGLDRGAAIVSHAVQPMPRFEEADVDLRRVLVDARQREGVEIVLDHAAVLDVDLLVYRVVQEPGDLAFKLFLH